MPSLMRFARSMARFTPRSNLEKLRQKLVEAGSPSKLGVNEFLGLRMVFAAVCGGAVFLLFAVTGSALTQLLLFPMLVAGSDT